MTDQNSVVVPQIRPEEVMDLLGVKKDAYYADIKFLGIKPQRDPEGKVYLDEEQFNLLKALRSHVEQTGKRDGFGAIATCQSDDLSAPGPQFELPQSEGSDSAMGFDLDSLIREAAELAGHRMTFGNQVVLALASQMTYEDLPTEVREKVDGVRSAAVPKSQPQTLARQLLSQWRQQRAVAA